MSILQRYWLYQAPGIGIVAALATAGTHWFAVPIWACVTAIGLWVAKDAILYPFLKSAYEGPQPTGLESMIGSLGTSQENLMPHGLVKVGAELWRAESGTPVQAGQIIRVSGCEGMTLLVEPVSQEMDKGRDLNEE